MGRGHNHRGHSTRHLLGHRAKPRSHIRAFGRINARAVEHALRLGRDVDPYCLQLRGADPFRWRIARAVCSGTPETEVGTSAHWPLDLGASVLRLTGTGPNRAALTCR